MKPVFLLLLAIAITLTGCSTTSTKRGATARQGQRMTVRTTAYTHTEAGGKNNAIGSRLRFGGDTYSAASDWSWMPLGTRFRMDSCNYVNEDYGSALVGRKTIDLYKPNMREVRRWGVRHVEIEILEWGSPAMSLKMLEPRAKRGYIRTMVAELRKTTPTVPRG